MNDLHSAARGWRYGVSTLTPLYGAPTFTGYARATKCRVLGFMGANWYLSLHWHDALRIRKFSVKFRDGRCINLVPRWMCAAS